MIGEFQLLTDNNGDFLTAMDRDTFLTEVTLYWVTGTVGSVMRIYRENRLTGEEMAPTPQLENSRGVRGFSEGGSCPSVSLDYSNIQRSTKN
jgi:hypothetical protein